MKNKTATVSSAQINAATDVKIDATITITRPSVREGNQTITLYPKRIQIRNQTGATIGFNILSSAEEEAEFDADDTNFEYISLANNTTLTFADVYPIPTPYKILIIGIAGVAASDLTVEMINYQARG